MTDHALFAPSASERWLNCPSALFMEKHYENLPTEYAEEGTAAHKLAERCLREGVISSLLYEGEDIHSAIINGVKVIFTVDKEMCAAVDDYLEICREHTEGAMFIEERVNFSPYCVDNSFGHADFMNVQTTNDYGEININDFKYGKGVEVPATTPQAKLYALGAYNTLCKRTHFIRNVDPENIIVNVRIIQPRMGNFDHQDYSLAELIEWAEMEVIPAAHIAQKIYNEDKEPVFKPGPVQCQWCLAKHDCKAHAEYNLKQVQLEFDDISGDNLPMPDSYFLTKEDNTNIMDHADAIISWLKGIKEFVRTEMLKGEDYLGYKLVRGKSNREWHDEDSAAKAMREQLKMKVSEVYEKKIISPAKLETKIGKKHKFFSENNLIDKPLGKPTVVPESDKRSSIAEETANEFVDETDPFEI